MGNPAQKCEREAIAGPGANVRFNAFGEEYNMKSKPSLFLCLPFVALGSAPAVAQQAADSGSTGEIVVTAQKRSESLHSVPVAVSVLTGATLAAAARPSIESATQLVPALNFQKSGTTLNQTIYLRGVGTATFSIAGEP
ncbi:hypothetical protein E4T56_gene3792, partial [Termitomyces sp. T112]